MDSSLKVEATIIGFFVLFTTISSTPNTNLISVLCNSAAYPSGDPFAVSLSYVLDDLENFMPTRKNYELYNISPYPNAFAYGHASCNHNLTTTSDCISCLEAAKKVMFSTCQSSVGARVVLSDCAIRYEQYPFAD